MSRGAQAVAGGEAVDFGDSPGLRADRRPGARTLTTPELFFASLSNSLASTISLADHDAVDHAA